MTTEEEFRSYYLGDKPKRKNKSPEHDIQVRLIKLLYKVSPKPLFSATTGGVRLALHTAKKMKDAGYSRGIPDLLIFEPRGNYVGLAIEVKTSTGRASKEQKIWVKQLQERGWRAEIGRGYEDCAGLIKEYFGLADDIESQLPPQDNKPLWED
jgi:hypothetical protein